MTTPYGGPAYGQPYPYPYPGGYPAPPPPPPRSRTGLWIGLGLTLLMVIATVCAAVLFVLMRNDNSTRSGDLTELTSSMLLPEEEFPEVSGGEFDEEPVSTDPEWDPMAIAPTTCFPLVQYPRATQATGRSNADSDGAGYSVTLRIDDSRPDMAAALAECETLEVTADDGRVDIRALTLDGVPDWAVAAKLIFDDDYGFTYVSGYYRGVLLDVTYWGTPSRTETAELVRIFNAQVSRLSKQ